MAEYWVYENWVHKRARLHRGECSYCNHGRGHQGSKSKQNGEWLGPFADRRTAFGLMERLRREDKGPCPTCAP
jgi:F-type H+-transporting ATPase subunit beta